MSKEGLYKKFNVTRTDGQSEPGQKHENCEYFVLDTDHDPYAKVALKAYAEACKGGRSFLSEAIIQRYKLDKSDDDWKGELVENGFEESANGFLWVSDDLLTSLIVWKSGSIEIDGNNKPMLFAAAAEVALLIKSRLEGK